MNVKPFKEYADLFGKGFRPYKGNILGNVYERLKCKDPKKAFWICKWPLLYCFGCNQRCCPTSEGFQAMLPEGDVRLHGKFSITPGEMVKAKSLLRADEAAYCLNISQSQVYALANEGKLDRHVDLPFRVTSESVINEMKRIDL